MAEQIQAAPVLNKPVVPGAAVKPTVPVVQANNVPDKPLAAAPKEVANGPILPEGPLLAQDRQPCNWNIGSTDVSDVIVADNVMTGKKFTGTRKQFAEYLRSK
jgi:hypothetical protein